MAKVKEKHPSWFKLKLERRELVRQLAPETAIKVLLACWEFLETGEKPDALSPIETIAFSAFIPDMEEAWSRYIQRITAKNNHTASTDIGRYHTTSGETEVEIEEDSLLSYDNRESRADKPPARFAPPTVEEVAAYCRERGSGIDPAQFVDYYAARGWRMGGNQSMKDWKATVRTWERRERGNDPPPPAPPPRGELVKIDGQEVYAIDS